MTKILQKVLIMAGGTGGHIFPGLAVAECLRAKKIRVAWLGTPNSMEERLVKAAQIDFYPIPGKGLRGKSFLTLLTAPWRIALSTFKARQVIKQLNVDVVIGMGGYVSGPGGLATWLLKKPLIIHEQNAIPGITNRILARWAKRVLCAFPNSLSKRHNAEIIGNPVRAEIENLPTPSERQVGQHQPWRLLVFGGSLGAQALNQLVPAAITLLPANKRPQVIHQTGKNQFANTEGLYRSHHINANLQPFINDMAKVYAWADVVLCRAGALTVSELCTAGIASILVPYPYAVDDHQTANAQPLVDAGAAYCVQEKDLTAASLAELLLQIADKSKIMANNAYKLGKKQVASKIVAVCEETIN